MTRPKKEAKKPEHSPLGASSASRWFKCPGSVKMSAGVVEPDSPYAQEGTAAHTLASDCLNSGEDAWEYMGSQITVERQDSGPDVIFVVDQEMVEGVQLYLDTIRADRKDKNVQALFIEDRFVLEDIDEDAYGTVDCGLLCADEDVVRVYDFKYGVGIGVEVKENEQEMYYAVGLVEHLVNAGVVIPSEVELVVVQPRHDHPDGPVRRWRLSIDALGEWAHAVLKKHIADTRVDEPALVAGDHCHWCPGKGKCPAIREEFDMMADDPFMKFGDLDDWELAERLERVPAVRKFIGYLEDEAFARMTKGYKVPGWKLVHKKSNRVWKEGAEEAVVEILGEDAAYTKKFRTPPQVEKLGKRGKDLVKENAYKPETGLTLAPESDRREAVSARTAKEAFERTG